ncbi:hypothetical protein [Methylomonas rapida]|uniref:Secreted protein n=1 Tax=Methylomonas rapida TaxID=2963939 RepID=A0ABY7GEZ7_9GAMM|nr:hypothetical protein [Methylomonas rapida]WAR43839.1 hypothetical protein NM686_015860 [Methylomonas rapida]
MKRLLCLLLLLLPPPSNADDIIAIKLPECEARLERRKVEPNLALVRSDCPLSLPSLALLLEQGLPDLFPDKTAEIRSIYLGRLMNYPDWSRLLAETAAKSPLWDAKRGRPRKRGEHDNRSVTTLLNEPAYPMALLPAFARYGLKPCIASVEKVLVFKVKELESAQQRVATSIPADARLPFDAQIWLSLHPLADSCGGR